MPYPVSAARGRIVTPVAAAWTPLDLGATLMGWWDFSDAATLYIDAGTTPVSTDAQAIYQVNDKSGNNRHAVQATESKRPAYKTAVQNGHSVARFDGGDALAAPGLAFDATQVTIVTVVKVAGAGEQRIFAPNQSQYGFFLRALPSANKYDLYWVNGLAEIANSTWATYQVVVARAVENTIAAISVNGGAEGLDETAGGFVAFAGGATNWVIGADRDQTGEYLTGDVGELLFCDTSLSSESIASVVAYALAKWEVEL